jgi:uncharacterized protein YndB with AHSA1/START domain
MDTIQLETWIKASRSTVFAALTTEDGLNAWWGKCLDAEPAVGHLVVFDHGLGGTLNMRITELVADQRLAWRCVSEFTDPANPASEWLGTTLTFDLVAGHDDPARPWMGARLGLEPGADLTILRFRHTDWPATNRWSPFCASAWGVTLDALAAHYTTS